MLMPAVPQNMLQGWGRGTEGGCWPPKGTERISEEGTREAPLSPTLPSASGPPRGAVSDSELKLGVLCCIKATPPPSFLGWQADPI